MRRSSITLVCICLLLGLAAGAGGSWYVASEKLGNSWNGAQFYGSAVEAKMQTLILTKLRQGESKDAIELLELTLDAKLQLLSGLKGAPIPEGKANAVAAALDEVRAYRKRHPAQQRSQKSQEAIDRLLSNED